MGPNKHEMRMGFNPGFTIICHFKWFHEEFVNSAFEMCPIYRVSCISNMSHVIFHKNQFGSWLRRLWPNIHWDLANPWSNLEWKDNTEPLVFLRKLSWMRLNRQLQWTIDYYGLCTNKQIHFSFQIKSPPRKTRLWLSHMTLSWVELN